MMPLANETASWYRCDGDTTVPDCVPAAPSDPGAVPDLLLCQQACNKFRCTQGACTGTCTAVTKTDRDPTGNDVFPGFVSCSALCQLNQLTDVVTMPKAWFVAMVVVAGLVIVALVLAVVGLAVRRRRR